jgi:hypothetical protein
MSVNMPISFHSPHEIAEVTSSDWQSPSPSPLVAGLLVCQHPMATSDKPCAGHRGRQLAEIDWEACLQSSL